MKLRRFSLLVLPLLVLPLLAVTAFADTADIGSAGSFSVLGASTVTNTGPTTMNGDLGVAPGSAITGFPPGSVGPPGTIRNTADSQAAQNAATTAYNTAAGKAPTSNLTGLDLGGQTLTPGVYKFNNSAQLTGILTLDAASNNNASWVFQIGSTLTTASASLVQVIGLNSGAFTGGITWQVGSSATLGTTTTFLGTIIALTSDTLNTGATIGCGRVIARGGAVTLDTNVISTPDASGNCAVTGGTAGGGGGTITPPPSPVPEPGTFGLLSVGLLAIVFLTFRKCA